MGIELGKPTTIPFGGLDLLRDWLQRRRRLFSQEARSLNLPQPKGVLLAGPPGTGKSIVAKNIATILNLPLLQLDIASMLGSLVGESEGNVRRALSTAEAIAPCVLWIDEVEKALSANGDTSGVSQRILGNILTFMSECTAGVFVVATCNDPTALPIEFKRKGRFDENFFVDLPTEPERCQILKIHLERYGIKVPQEYLEAITASTSKFSGAEDLVRRLFFIR
jgi:SpoVK/Ycf46/Vps4 family AAA+-type ATPase